MKIALVTAIFGGIDEVHVPMKQTCPHQYFLFNEQNCPADINYANDRLRAKFFKIQTHRVLPEFDLFVWMDGTLKMATNLFLEQVIQKLGDNDALFMNHVIRKCVYEEAEEILKYLKDDKSEWYGYFRTRFTIEEIEREIESYRKAGYPENAGLWSGGFFVRRNNERTNNFFNKWWDSILRYGCKDQMSLAYHINTYKEIKITFMEDLYGNKIERSTHKK